MAQLTLEMPESAFDTLHPRIGNAQRTAWVFIDGGIWNVPTTTGFSSRVSRNLRGTGRNTSRRVTVFCGRKSRVRFSPFLSAASPGTVWRVCAAPVAGTTFLWPFPAGPAEFVRATLASVLYCSGKRSGKSFIP
jgi:hypothetical protein